MSVGATSPGEHSLLRSRRYALFWVASLFSNVGSWMQLVAQPWVMLTISQSSFLVGLDSFALNAPGWLLTLWAGVLADRMDRKRLIIMLQAAQAVAVVGLVVLMVLGILNPWLLILVSLTIGVTDSLTMPSFQAIVPSLVKTEEIPRAVSLNSIQFNLSRTLGPVIAGIMMARFGATICFAANALSFLPFFLSIIWIYPAGSPSSAAYSGDGSAEDPNQTISGMLREVLEAREIRLPLFSTFVTTLFCSPIITFCPVLVHEVFHGSSADFGLVSAAFGLGGGCLERRVRFSWPKGSARAHQLIWGCFWVGSCLPSPAIAGCPR
jgi:MFS family permease